LTQKSNQKSIIIFSVVDPIKKHPDVFKKAHLIQTNKTHQNPTLFFPFEKCTMKLKVK